MRHGERKTPVSQLLYGLGLGLLFGFALQRAGVTNYDVILRTLLLRDLVVVKVMLSAIIVGAIGVYALRALDMVQLHIREATVAGNIVGGLVFGVGFGILGYCPGTAIGAAAEGRLDALIGGILGMLVGSALFAFAYPDLKDLLKLGHIGAKTFWEVLGLNPWAVIVPLSVILIGLMWWFEQIGV